MNLVAPTAFKGTMSPLEAARHLAAPGDRLLPLSDGGDGFLECLHHALGGVIEEAPAGDPFGRVRRSRSCGCRAAAWRSSARR
jgi:glycerate kinase